LENGAWRVVEPVLEDPASIYGGGSQPPKTTAG